MQRRRLASLVLVLWAAGLVAPASAQTITGTILGIVSDPSGAAVPQARVTVVNENTGQQREIQSDDTGGYLATFLPVGVYTVTVEKQGFRKASLTGIVIQVDQQVRLNATL